MDGLIFTFIGPSLMSENPFSSPHVFYTRTPRLVSSSASATQQQISQQQTPLIAILSHHIEFLFVFFLGCALQAFLTSFIINFDRQKDLICDVK